MRDDVHMVVWVTSRCNLRCPLCNERSAIEENPNYDMPLEELHQFIDSSVRRGIHYAAVELTGGEPTLWPHFVEGLRMLANSEIANWTTFVTNGRDATAVASAVHEITPVYGVSATQATPEQVAEHLRINPNVFVNSSPHRRTPDLPVPGSLPAICVVENNRVGRHVLPLAYYDGWVYHCCTARALGGHRLSCPFEGDFLQFFTDTPRSQPICQQCLCNSKVWSSLS